MEILLYLLIGGIFGAMIMRCLSRYFVKGTLRIDKSDPYEGPYLFLELNHRVSNIGRGKYILLKIEESSYDTQNKQRLL